LAQTVDTRTIRGKKRASFQSLVLKPSTLTMLSMPANDY